MKVSLGKSQQYGSHFYFELEISASDSNFEQLAKKIFAALGLTDMSLVANFNYFLGVDFFGRRSSCLPPIRLRKKLCEMLSGGKRS